MQLVHESSVRNIMWQTYIIKHFRLHQIEVCEALEHRAILLS